MKNVLKKPQRKSKLCILKIEMLTPLLAEVLYNSFSAFNKTVRM